MGWQALADGLGADPIEKAEHLTGEWAIRLLAVALAVTPLRLLTGWGWLQLYRRPLGLFAAFYATLHVLVFFALDLALAFDEFASEVIKRPYLTVGMLAFGILALLAATSTKGWIRRLGARRWQRLHSLVYVAAVAALVHFTWSQKKDITDPLIWMAVFAGLGGVRLWHRWRGRQRAAAGVAAVSAG
ncbi:MAG: sulfoxide reductase heme-binding subunit YedZ [Gemmatimonadaceae bacterium]|jgi:sulfoxide reductase heme-binding subunit YedZ|nr:sulfoxide reductase heme-binding subunit YedZ [Gemmatimonadaceae bacterium]